MFDKTLFQRAGHVVALLALIFTAPVLAEDAAIDFVHDIVPALRVHCGKCHTGTARQGGFSLNTRELTLAGGDSGSAGFVAKDSANSEIIARITSDDPDYRMPSEGDPLPAEAVALLRRWIDSGAPWTDDFSFTSASFELPLAIRKIELPPVIDGRTNPVDRIVDAYWSKHGITRPPRSDDRTFIRRVSLDLVGLLPDPSRVELFVADTNPHKRALLVRDLLDDKLAYAEHWMTFWNDLLRNDYTGTGFITGGRKQITKWLHRALVSNMPFDQFVRELVSPTDESRGFIDGIVWRGEVNASQTVPIQFAQNVGQTFLGINFKCASCHDSFVDRWTLQQTYDLAAIFSNEPLELHRCDKATGRQAKPAWLFGELGQVDAAQPPAERLKQLATIMTKPENGWLSRTLVNRLWHRLLGRGLVHPVDSLRTPPWNEDLLDYLAGELVARNWDVKQLLEVICTSETYGAVTPSVEGLLQGDKFVFRGPLPRRLTAEQFIDAVWMLAATAPAKHDAGVRRDITSTAAAPIAKWIWSNEQATSPPGEKLAFRKQFSLPSPPTHAVIAVTADNSSELFVNGKRYAGNSDWNAPVLIDVGGNLRPGNNEIVAVATNALQGGPAALRAEIRIKQADGSETIIGTDGSWEYTTQLPDENGQFAASASWLTAVAITNSQIWSAADAPFEQRLLGRESSQRMVRSVVVKCTPLMAALGRPNRDQVITNRPNELTTLEAILLANEQSLADDVFRGGEQILAQHGPDSENLLNWMFAAALSRPPSTEEAATAREILGTNPTAQKVADCFWAIIMLPEFQLVR